MTYIKVFRNKDLAPKRALKWLWGNFEGRLGRRTPLETAPIRVFIIARGGLVVNDFCGWFVMKKGRGRMAAVSAKPHAARGRGVVKGVKFIQRSEMKKELSRLERDTATYFENMTEEEAREERELEAAMCDTPKQDVDAPED